MNINKKAFIFSALILFSLVFVSAAETRLGFNLERGAVQLIDIIESIFGPIFYFILGGGTGLLLFERILFFLIVLSVTYIALKNIAPFKENGPAVWVITLAVSILASRFLTDNQLINTILLPYSAFGVAVTAILPFLIYLWFVQTFTNGAWRKILWIFYIVVFIAIWSERSTELGSISWLYFWSAVAAFLFLLFDGTIRRMIIRAELNEVQEEKRAAYVADLNRELDELIKNRNNWPVNAFKKKEKSLRTRIAESHKIFK